MTTTGTKRSPIRFREGTWEYRCAVCREWLALDDEFWITNHMTRCRACWSAYHAAYGRERRAGSDQRVGVAVAAMVGDARALSRGGRAA